MDAAGADAEHPRLTPDLRPGWAGEPKWDGFRAAVLVDAGRVVLRSRHGTQMGPAFAEIVAGAVQKPDATAFDGELVVQDAAGRLAFARLQNRLARRGGGAVRAAEEWPAHFVAFDLLRSSGTDTTRWPYRRRQSALESVFVTRRLFAPWALCPSTTDPATVREGLSWASVGTEGVVFKRLTDPYRPSVRGWAEVQGPPDERGDRRRGHRLPGRSADTAARPVRRRRPLPVRRPHDHAGPGGGRCLAGLFAAERGGHPWTGWSFSANWGTQRTLEVFLVEPEVVMEVVMEVAVDVARDSGGRWRHPARPHRVRTDISVQDVPLFGEERV
ncbi:ATP-dependent DNA ligase [Streptomyces sp. NPDC093598]|uniref:ATP-dependent DNA ligase n=1 Tax=Streptomyces sp. NPDC093598 TaxID=3366046 RepID=UPI0038100C4B